MAVYIDNFYVTGGGDFGRMKMSHMIADTSEELVEMAKAIGMKPEWIQNPGTPREHFDVCMSKRLKAIKLGAKAVPFRELAVIWQKKKGKV
jgi:hypothetical protein